MSKHPNLASVAKNLLDVRARRLDLFPSDIFDEHAWTMLLHLFVAHAEDIVLSEPAILRKSGTSIAVGRRWLAHLVADGQVEGRDDDTDVVLTAPAIVRMRTLLAEAARIHATDAL